MPGDNRQDKAPSLRLVQEATQHARTDDRTAYNIADTWPGLLDPWTRRITGDVAPSGTLQAVNTQTLKQPF